MSDQVCVGAVMGAFGVRGEVRLKSFCADPAAIETYGPLTDEAGQSYTLKITRSVKNGFAVRLSGVATKEAADGLRGTRLYAPRTALPDLSDDEYYHADLIGLTVLDTGGATLGQIKAVHNHGASDLLEIATLTGSVLLPFTLESVPTVDLSRRSVVADPPEGLFGEET